MSTAGTVTSGAFAVNTAKNLAVKSQIAACQKQMSVVISEIEALVNNAQTVWSADYMDTIKSTMSTYIKNIRTKQETLAENTEKYLGYAVELTTATEKEVLKNAALFDD